jgi:DnaJ-class molecular chaperone
MTTDEWEEWAESFALLDAKNRAEGKCTTCGGAGEVFDVSKITRTHHPFHGKKCPLCKGTGKPRQA